MGLPTARLYSLKLSMLQRPLILQAFDRRASDTKVIAQGLDEVTNLREGVPGASPS
jgi:hypothetical protein